MDGTDQDQGWNPGRRLPIGAEARPGGGVHFRVWAPRHPAVAVEFDDDAVEALLLAPEGNGYYSGTAPAAGAGTGYRFRLGDGKSTSAGECAFAPDPASRFQPEGLHGPSRGGRSLGLPLDRPATGAGSMSFDGQVLYELHVGTFTPAGTWTAAAAAAPVPRRPGRHGPGDHAGGRVPRHLRLGLRRRRSVRPVPRLRQAR